MALHFNVKGILTDYQRAFNGLDNTEGKTISTADIVKKYPLFFKFMDAIVQAAPKQNYYPTYEDYLNDKLHLSDARKVSPENTENDFNQAVSYAENVLNDDSFRGLTENDVRDYLETLHLGAKQTQAESIGTLARTEDTGIPTDMNAQPISDNGFGLSLHDYYKKLHAAENRTPAA